MKKILILGICGAGKSVLARKLGKVTGIEVIHLDQYYWKPNWVEPDKAKWEKIVKELIAKPRWIMDGNYTSTLPIRVPEADMIIFLDFSRYTAIYRAMKRTFQYYKRLRPDSAPNCEERLSLSFLRYIWNYPSHHSLRTKEAIQSYGKNKPVFRLTNQNEVDSFLEKFKDQLQSKH